MRAEAADIGLGTLAPMPGLARRPILSDRFGVVCRADHPLAGRWQSLGWADLADTAFIANGLCGLIGDAAFRPILESARICVHNTASILSMVRAGIGITVLPELAVLPDFADLVFLPLDDSTARREIHMLTPEATRMIPAARALAEAIVAHDFQPS